MGIQHSTTFASLSPLGEACSRKDLTAIHEVMENIGYKDDEGVANEVLYLNYILLISWGYLCPKTIYIFKRG